MTRQHSLPLSVLPTLCLVKLVAVSSTNPAPFPHLDHLALLALEATTEPAPPPSLEAWLKRLRGIESSEAVLGVVEDIHNQVHKIRRRGLDAAITWAHNEMKPMIAWNEDDEVSLHNFPLLRSSPLGMYLRRTYLQLSKMGFDEAVEWWEEVGAWCDGTLVPTGRKELEGVEERSSPQEALLRLALLEYEDGGFVAAQQALDEATQIARTMGDVACLSSCSSLRKRLFTSSPNLAESSSSSSCGLNASSSSASNGTLLPHSTTNPNTPYDLLHSMTSSFSNAPLPSLFSPLYSSLALHERLSFPPIPSSSSSTSHLHHQQQQKKEDEQRPLPPAAGMEDGDFAAAWECASAGLWAEMGIPPLSSLHSSLALSLLSAPSSPPSWSTRISLLSLQASALVRADQHDEALELLLEAAESREKRAGMGVGEVRAWKGLVEWVEDEREARRRGRYDPTVQDPQLAFPTLLSHSLLSLQQNLLSSAQPNYFLSLLSVIDHRLSLGTGKEEGERGLRECEEAWGGVLAVGSAVGGEWKIVEARAKEVKARCAVVACQGEDTRLPAAVELLEEALAIYSSLSLPSSLLRTLSTLVHLSSHLSTSPSLPPTSAAHWRGKRDMYARKWVEVKKGMEREGEDEEEERARRERVREVVRGVERAVGVKVGIRR
ncbi:hypothetical protein JCM11251_000494 [Rhodosporidiobolus azoricus]